MRDFFVAHLEAHKHMTVCHPGPGLELPVKAGYRGKSINI